MAKLVKKSQQLTSIQEGLRSIDISLREIEKDLIQKDQAGRLTEYDVLRATGLIDQLQQQKEELLEKKRQLERSVQERTRTKEHGNFSFFNLVGAVSIPIQNAEKVFYIKIYEIVNAREMSSGGENVFVYRATLSDTKPSKQENYFASKIAMRDLPNVIEYTGEEPGPSIPYEIKNMIQRLDSEYDIVASGLSVYQTGKAFKDEMQRDILTLTEKILFQLARDLEEQNKTQEKEES